MKRSILHRLRLAITIFFVVLGTGTFVYKHILHLGWVDALYFTVVTIATVGYGDIQPLDQSARLFTIVFILGGLGAASYSISIMMVAIIEGEVRGELKHLRMIKEIEKLKNHVILCGFGRIGAELAASFMAESVPCVVIEQDDAALAQGESLGYLMLKGDATTDEALRIAGIERAKSVVPALASDADNLFIVISARQLNPKLTIIARATDESTAVKMTKAGADRIVRPLHIGANHFAQAVLRPTVLDFIQVSGRRRQAEFQIEEVLVSPGAAIVGRTLAEISLRREIAAILIGIKRAQGDLVFNPSAETLIQAGDTMVAIGGEEDMNKLRTLAAAGA